MSIREIFVKAFVKSFGDYHKYNAIIEEVPIFNTQNFLESKPDKEKAFYSEFTETQIFRNFLQFEPKEYFPYFFNQIEKYKNLSGKDKKTLKHSNSIISGRRSNIFISLNDDEEMEYKEIILNSKLKS